jgi:hypothetical protein
MHQGSSLESVTGTFLAEIAMREAAKVIVNDRNEAI